MTDVYLTRLYILILIIILYYRFFLYLFKINVMHDDMHIMMYNTPYDVGWHLGNEMNLGIKKAKLFFKL